MQRPWSRSKWFLPLFSAALGLVMLAAHVAGGHPGQGVVSMAIMVVFGAVVAAGRGDTVRGFRGDGTDERFRQLNLRATATTGQVLTLVVIVAFVVEIARGHSGAPFAWLGSVAGLTYLVALAWFRSRG
ncbi:MAG TPA: hypothetical protein VFN55_02075 [Solirubrobacteraceae bacterium]|nr:hypothetical protein [Solirubrobacteraceae bacterium]